MRLSKNNGLNPTIPVCYVCGKDKNEIVLTGAAGNAMARELGHKDGQMPMHCCMDVYPCDDCISMIKKGLVLAIVCKDKQIMTGMNDEEPERTGELIYVPKGRLKDFKGSIAFIEESVAAVLKAGSNNVLEREKFEKEAGKDWTIEDQTVVEDAAARAIKEDNNG